MKNLFQFLALVMLLSFTSCNDHVEEDKGMETGNLYVSKSKPQPGDKIMIKYAGEDPKNTEATVNYLVEDRYYPADIALKDSAEAFYGKVIIPDTVHAIAFNFEKENKYDTNNNKGYVIALYNEDGEELKKSEAARGVYLSSGANNFDLKFEKDSAIALIGSDINKNPEIEEDFDTAYANAMLTVNREKANSYMDERIEYYNQKDSLTADNYNTLSELYGIKNENAKRDSVVKVGVEKYPKSEMAKRNLMMKVVTSQKIDEKLEHFQTYEDKIGSKGYEKNIMLRYLANAYAAEEDWENFKKYASQIEDPGSMASVYNSAAWKMAEKGEDLGVAEKISKKSLELLDSPSALTHKPDYYTKKQFQESLDYSKAMYADTYALIKYKQGDREKAIEIQEDAISEKSSADANTRYVQYLTEAEQYEKVIEKAEEFMTDNRASADMEKYLKTAYSKTDNNETYGSFLATIKEEAKTNAREELKKGMLDEEAPSFKLKDLQGKEIALAELKGKTIILDFWATWCGPCKISFPGMQKAVEKYADNENVKFFFVNTWETGENRKKEVSDFIENNDYSFHVLMDKPVAEGSREFNTTSDFGINGIPTKIIIGPEGKINFRVVGYDGNNEKLLQEIGLMIDLTQKDEKPKA